MKMSALAQFCELTEVHVVTQGDITNGNVTKILYERASPLTRLVSLNHVYQLNEQR